MARFKRRMRRIGRSIRRAGRRYSRSTNPLKIVIPAAIYGAGRQYLVILAKPLTSMVPLGQYADEAVLGTAGYLLAKKGKGMLKNVGTAMLTIEAASLGAGLVGGSGGSSGGNGGAF